MNINRINPPSGRPPGILLLADSPSLGMKMMTTPVVRCLKQACPQSRIGVLTSESGSGFYRNSPYGLTIHEESDVSWLSAGSTDSALKNIRAAGYDVVVSLPFQEGKYAELVINNRMHFSDSIGSNRMLSALLLRYSEDVFERYKFDHDVVSPCGIVEPEEYMGKIMLRYVEPLGIYNADMRPEAWSSDKDAALIGSMFEANGIGQGDYAVTLNLSANQMQNQWRMRTLAETASIMNSYWARLRLNDTCGKLVFLANYYAPSQKKFFDRFMGALGQLSVRPPVIGMPNNGPGELSAIIGRSSYVVTTETGTAHIAQALDVPATVVYGTEAVEKGWMLPGSRVVPLVSDIYQASPDDIATGSLFGIAQWRTK